MNKRITIVLIGILLSGILGVPVSATNERLRPLTNISEATQLSGILGVPVNTTNEKPRPLNNMSETMQITGQGVMQRSITAAVTQLINIGNNPIPRRDRSKKDMMKRNVPSIVPGTGDFGSYLVNTPGGIKGVYAMQQVQPALNLPGLYEPTLYAPTVMSPNFAPIESVTAYWNYSGMTSTAKAWGVWSHYTGGWVVLRDIDSNFMSNYVGTYPEGQFYFTEIKQDGTNGTNTWNVLLYNFKTYSWEIQYSSDSQSQFEYGWDMFETYFNGTCPPLPSISSNDIMVLSNGQWELVTNTYGSLLDNSNCASYKEDMTPFYKWSVSTPVVTEVSTSVETKTPVTNAINITYPIGGETLKRGRTYNITWSITGNTGAYVKIELLQGSYVTTVLTRKTKNTGIYKWKIPFYQTAGTNYKVRITSNTNRTYTDTSDKSFTISN
ncbi:MAG TPA: Ser-Thr-rich GPI-anchored membrane family protein [Candidatus Methanoperedens sp.]